MTKMNTTMNATMITRLTKEMIAARMAEMRTGFENLNKEARIMQKYVMSPEQNEAWACLLYYMEADENHSITVPLSDIWQENLPGAEDITVTLEGAGDDGYYLAVNYDGDVYDVDVEDVSFRLPARGFSYTLIDGLPAECTVQNILLHTALVQLLTDAGVFEDETQYNEYR